jgi:4'-phosphopantetheinyl transferase
MEIARVGFLIQQLSEVPEGHDWLSAGECARLDGFRFPKRRGDWLLGRWTAKCTLQASYLLEGRTPPPFSAWEIRSAADGAPEVFLSGDSAPVSISISHSSDRGLCVLAAPGMSLGCDLETVVGRDAHLLKEYFRDEEIDLVSSVPYGEMPKVATLIWSAKESALKCMREGLRRDTRSVLVSLAAEIVPGWNLMSVRCMESGIDYRGWWMCEEGFVQTIASDTPLAIPKHLAPPPGIA